MNELRVNMYGKNGGISETRRQECQKLMNWKQRVRTG